MEQEIWKDIEGFSGYQISNLGRVKSYYNNKRILLKQNKIGRGYYVVNLYKNNISKTSHVHRLVAEAFIENKYNKLTVNHINGLKTDNNVNNLEWATYSENTKHAWKTGLMENTRKSNQKNTIIATETLKMPIYSSKLNMQFESVRYASRYIQKTYYSNINVDTIRVSINDLIAGRKQTSMYDYGWSYINN